MGWGRGGGCSCCFVQCLCLSLQMSHGNLLKRLKTETLLKVFASILLERRLIFVAKDLNTLSTCIHSITSLLYPFSWQHTLVPILPQSMIDVCGSPTPYILGIVNDYLPELQSLTLEEVRKQVKVFHYESNCCVAGESQVDLCCFVCPPGADHWPTTQQAVAEPGRWVTHHPYKAAESADLSTQGGYR